MFISKIVPALLLLFLLFSSSKKTSAQKASENTLLPFNLCWQNQMENPQFKVAASDNESKIYLAIADGSIETFDFSSGAKLWKSDMGNRNIIKISQIDNNIYVLSDDNEAADETIKKLSPKSDKKLVLTIISSETGLIISREESKEADKEKKHTGLNETESQKLLSEIISDDLRVIADEKGNIRLVNFDLSKSIWSMKVGAKVSSFTYLKGEKPKIAVTSFDNFVYMISVKNGGKIWKKRLPGRIIETPLVDEKVSVFMIAGEKAAFILDTENGKQLGRIELKGDSYLIKPLLKTANKYLFQTTDGLALFSQDVCSK